MAEELKTFIVCDPGEPGQTYEIPAASWQDLQEQVALAFRQPGFLRFKGPGSEGAYVMVRPHRKFEDLPNNLEWMHRPQGAASSSQAGAGAGAAAGVIKSFKSKLALYHITAPHEHIIARLITHYGNSLTLAASAEAPPDAALDLYRAAEMMPGSKTLRVIANELKLAVNGPLRESDPHIVSAIDLNDGKPLVIKVLMTHEATFQQAANADLFAVDRLSLNAPTAPLVKTKVVEFDLSESDVHALGVGCGARKLLLMPWFAGSLASLPQLSASLIAQGVQRMEEALSYMHDRGLVHMDVKPGNILMDLDGQWFLGDFGASLLVGSAVPFGMRTVYPGALPTKAFALIDWRQLVVTVAMLLDKKNVDGIMAQTSAIDTPSPEKVKALCDTRCQRPENKDLQDVMCRLYRRAQWEEVEPGKQ